MSKTEAQYKDVIQSAEEIFVNKTKDYGTAWRILRPSSLTDQLYIKAARIRSFEIKGIQKVNESIEGEFIALINYSVMALIQLELDSGLDNLEMSLEEATQLYQKHLAYTLDLMKKKNHDYGEAWRDMRTSSMTDLILMKLLRIKQIEDNNGATIISEGMDANYHDIINYAIFALIQLSEKSNN